MRSGTGYLRRGDVSYLVGSVLLGVAAALLLTGLVGLAMRDGSGWPLLLSAAATAVLGGLPRFFTHRPDDINFREAFATVAFSWTAVALVGALPYLFAGVVDDPAAAIFESMSGFTTTGATVFTNIEGVAPGILLWRSMTQWLGGMGFIVLGVAVLPHLGVGGMQLFRLESPGPTADRLQPRIRETARILWLVYVVLTGVLILLFLFGGMPLFDAVNHALTTMPTGGFSTQNGSLGVYGAHIQWIAILFMYLGGINFTLHYRILGRGTKAYWRDPEWRLYTGIIAGSCLIVALLIAAPGMSLEQILRDATFQVVSIITTTGFITSDYALWAPAAQAVIFLLFFLGGMAGSTSGGMKMIRVLLVLKHAWIEIRKQLHPRAVFVHKVGNRAVPDHITLNVLGFALIYIILFGVGTFVMSLFGLSLPAAAGAAASAISNVGPGLAELGPTAHYGWIAWQTQLFLAFLMLVGRLEIYTIVILFHPGLWRR